MEVFHPGRLGSIEGIIERLTIIQVELELLIEGAHQIFGYGQTNKLVGQIAGLEDLKGSPK